MAHGKAGVLWGTTSSIVRAICLAMTGNEPPLAAFIPHDFLPEERQRQSLTKDEREQLEETKRKRDELDRQILAKAMKEGKFKGRLNGTRK